MASSIQLNAHLQVKNGLLQKADIKSQGFVSTLMTPEVSGRDTNFLGYVEGLFSPLQSPRMLPLMSSLVISESDF